MVERGKFFIIEGVGGSGKSTQLDMSAEFMNNEGYETLKTREPGGIKEAEQIREMIFNLKRESMINADQQIALFFAARHIWMQNLVAPNLDNNVHVISDRSYPATGAYQGYGELGNVGYIELLSKKVMGEHMPNGIILLDVSVETSMERNKLNKDGDPFDDEDKDYFSRVIRGYQEMAASRWSDVDWYVVDAERSIEDVQSNIQDILIDVLKQDQD